MQIEGSVRPKLALHILSTPLVLPLKTVSFQNCPSALLKCPSAGRGLPVTPNSSVEAKGKEKLSFSSSSLAWPRLLLRSNTPGLSTLVRMRLYHQLGSLSSSQPLEGICGEVS